MWSREHLAEEELKRRGATLREKGKSFVPWRKEESWREGAESDKERKEDMGARNWKPSCKIWCEWFWFLRRGKIGAREATIQFVW